MQEKYGIIFAFLGDLPEEERPPLLEVEEYGQDGWRANTILTIDIDYYYERSVENGLDPAHNEFVHPTHGFSGVNRETYKVRDYETEDHLQGWGFWFMHRFDAPPLEKSKGWGDARTEAGRPVGRRRHARAELARDLHHARPRTSSSASTSSSSRSTTGTRASSS